MPICDGVEAAKRLRALENKRKRSILLPSTRIAPIPGCWLTTRLVVALSADCQDSTKQLCLSAGMNAFFCKPLQKGMSYLFHLLSFYFNEHYLGDLTSLLTMFATQNMS